jgi:hypothetical protein
MILPRNDDARLRLLELVGAFNWHADGVKASVDLDDGEIRLEQSVFLGTSAALPHEIFHSMIWAVAAGWEEFRRAVPIVLYGGKSPRVALEMATAELSTNSEDADDTEDAGESETDGTTVTE